MSEKKKILTGLKPTGEITLGNYIGALSQMVQMQEEYDSYLFVFFYYNNQKFLIVFHLLKEKLFRK